MERTPRLRKAIHDDNYIYYDDSTKVSFKFSPKLNNMNNCASDNVVFKTRSTVDYCLNVDKALNKKRKGCDDNPLNVTYGDKNIVMNCSTAAFEILKNCVATVLNSYHVIKNVIKEKNGANVSETVRVYHKTASKKKGTFIVCINFYNTTSTVLINGNQLVYFKDNVLQCILNAFEKMYSPIMDSRIKSCMESSAKLSHDSTVPSTNTDVDAHDVITPVIPMSPDCSTDVIPSTNVIPANDAIATPVISMSHDVISDVLPLLHIKSSQITDEDKSSQNSPIKTVISMSHVCSTDVMPTVIPSTIVFSDASTADISTIVSTPCFSSKCNVTLSTPDCYVLNPIQSTSPIPFSDEILPNVTQSENVTAIFDTPCTSISPVHIASSNSKAVLSKKKKVKSFSSSKINKLSNIPTIALTPINKKFEKMNNVIFSVNEQHVEITDKICDVKNKLNERCSQLENAIANVRKNFSSLSTDFKGNFTNLNDSVRNLDHICCSQTSTFEMMLAEAVNKINSVSKNVQNEVEISKSNMLMNKSNIISEITMSVQNYISSHNDDVSNAHTEMTLMNEKFENESNQLSLILSMLDERVSNHSLMFSSLTNQLTALSTRVNTMFTHVKETNVNTSSSVFSETLNEVHKDSSPDVTNVNRTKKRFNPFVHNFNPSTHRLFRGSGDPLSNMYTHRSCNRKCMLNVNTLGFSGCFDSSEKAFTYFKALFNHRYDLLDSIFTCSSPWDCKKIGDKIHVYDHWLSIREQVMLDIQLAKYIGCTAFRQHLYENRDKFIVENTSDPFWGRGVDNTGKNILGIIHMKLSKLIYSV